MYINEGDKCTVTNFIIQETFRSWRNRGCPPMQKYNEFITIIYIKFSILKTYIKLDLKKNFVNVRSLYKHKSLYPRKELKKYI